MRWLNLLRLRLVYNYVTLGTACAIRGHQWRYQSAGIGTGATAVSCGWCGKYRGMQFSEEWHRRTRAWITEAIERGRQDA